MIHASWQGHISASGGRIAAWFDAPGRMTVRLNGQTFIGDETNAGDIAGCSFSGLPAGVAMNAEILLDGVSQGSRTVWTARTDNTVRAVWVSCIGSRHAWGWATKRIRDFVPDFVVFLGDTMYLDEGATTIHGLPRTYSEDSYAEAIDTTASGWNTIRFMLLHEGFQQISAICPILLQWDDHEILSDFRNHLSGGSDSGMQGQFAWIDTQEKLDTIKAVRTTIARGVIHAANELAATGDYYSFTYGPGHFIVPDLCTEKGARIDTTDMVSTEQLAWIKDELTNSALFKFCMHTKNAADGNADSWSAYGGLTNANSQLVDIWDHIVTNEIATVVVLTGDKHWPHVQYQAAPTGLGIAENAYSPYLGICPSPMNQFFTPTGLAGADIVAKFGPENAIGFLEATAELATYKIVGVNSVLWMGQQRAGANTLVYPTGLGI